jgi:hypothetical protein
LSSAVLFVYDSSWPLWGRALAVAAAVAVFVAMVWRYLRRR